MRYAHLSPQAMLEAANVVGNVVAGARVGRSVAAVNQTQAVAVQG